MSLAQLRAQDKAVLCKARRSPAVRVAASSVRPQRQPVARVESLASKLASAGAAAAVAMALLVSAPAPAQAAQLNSLADVMRTEFEFVDTNKDGVITLGELQQLSSQMAEEEGMVQPSDSQLSFTLRLFDLNQDGNLTTDEMLTSLALDAVVSDDAVDADAVKVFDRNGDGLVERGDWSAPFGDMGPQGEVVKAYIYDRVDHLFDGDGKLNTAELGNALTLVRTLALGY